VKKGHVHAPLPFARWFFVTLCQVPQRRMLALQKVMQRQSGPDMRLRFALFWRADRALFWFCFGFVLVAFS
jgi:hypothetical protein